VGAAQVPREFVLGTLRLSTGRHTTLDEVDRAVLRELRQTIGDALRRRMRNSCGAAGCMQSLVRV